MTVTPSHGAGGEIESDDGVRFHGARTGVAVRERAHGGYVGSEDKAQAVDAVDADVADGSAGRERGIVDPGAWAAFGRIGKLGVCELWLADAAFGDPPSHDVEATVVAHVLGHTEGDAGGVGCGEHLLDLAGVQGQRLFAQDGFAVFCGEQDMGKVKRVRGDDEDGVDFRRGAEGFGSVEDERDGELAGTGLGLGGIATPQTDELRVLRLEKALHEPLGGVMSKAEDAVSGHKLLRAAPELLGDAY